MTMAKKLILAFVTIAISGVVLVASLTMSIVQISSATRYYEAYGTAESSYEQMMKKAILTKEEFVDELSATVRATAEDVGFDPATAIALLEGRWNSLEVSVAIEDQNVDRLDWVFCEVLSAPIESQNGKHYEMEVKPLAVISVHNMPGEVLVHGHAEDYPGRENLSVGDKVLFCFDPWQLNGPDRMAGEPAWRTYGTGMVREP